MAANTERSSVYQMDSYRHWEQQLGRSDFTFGQFGENFTVEGLPDGEVCIGPTVIELAARRFEVTKAACDLLPGRSPNG